MASDMKMVELPELSFRNVASEASGVDPTIVSRACDELNTYAENMKVFISDLEVQQAELMNEWEGAAAETLKNLFPGLIEAFAEIPGCITSIADWAESYTKSMVSFDEALSSGLEYSLGGK